MLDMFRDFKNLFFGKTEEVRGESIPLKRGDEEGKWGVDWAQLLFSPDWSDNAADLKRITKDLFRTIPEEEVGQAKRGNITFKNAESHTVLKEIFEKKFAGPEKENKDLAASLSKMRYAENCTKNITFEAVENKSGFKNEGNNITFRYSPNTSSERVKTVIARLEKKSLNVPGGSQGR